MIEKIKEELKFKGNIYHYFQVNFAYNSNKIEGSRLTSDQTEYIIPIVIFLKVMT